MVEPKCPGAVECYVNLGECYHRNALRPLREEIGRAMTGYKDCYQRAYRCLGAAAALEEDMRAILLTPELEERLAKRAKGILGREARAKGGEPGEVRQRFLGAVTHLGPICRYETALAQCPKVYELSDPCGLAHSLLLPLLTGLTEGGYGVVACPDPMAPSRLAHLLVPELGLAFLSATGEGIPGVQPHRRIRLEGAADPELVRRSRSRLRFARKVSAALMEEAVSSLAQAKAMHDDLEAIYNPHVDFAGVERKAEKIVEEIEELRVKS